MRSNIVLTFCWINITVVPLHSAFECPDWFWDKRFGACYFEPGGAWSYHEQLANCTRFGASLVSIHDDEENAWINLLTFGSYQPYFIGLKRENCHAEWEWADGTPLDFTDWNEGKYQNA